MDLAAGLWPSSSASATSRLRENGEDVIVCLIFFFFFIRYMGDSGPDPVNVCSGAQRMAAHGTSLSAVTLLSPDVTRCVFASVALVCLGGGQIGKISRAFVRLV